MRKVTIILIAAIYVASIVIVGVFGLEAAPYDEFRYIDDFVFTEINDTLVEDVGNSKFVMLPYQENLIVYIHFTVAPANATEADNVTVEVISPTDYEDIATLSYEVGRGWILKFSKPGIITLRIQSPDTRKVEKELIVYVS